MRTNYEPELDREYERDQIKLQAAEYLLSHTAAVMWVVSQMLYRVRSRMNKTVCRTKLDKSHEDDAAGLMFLLMEELKLNPLCNMTVALESVGGDASDGGLRDGVESLYRQMITDCFMEVLDGSQV
jgi:hypothetical protein